ncbi:ankyrin repeat and LEM domain-containing protein 1 [Diabrotica virgifera virgifera]|uniref:Ankyrin repeat and LEM domain-containing protein 1 n=1 Tax=Diabrotica virgifera virgifera TaxID=50390 RepID=A0A6P7F3Y6_DIAVI|nr:ankyrin repeat and LEM domain-containing protein 1 [Diabrotica virgifera virgifera]
MSFVTYSTSCKHEDKDEGIVLYEKRLHSVPSNTNERVQTLSSKTSSTINYNATTLRKELISLGFPAGPVTDTTKTVYLNKLYQLKKLSTKTSSTISYDANTLRTELISLGFPAGPVTDTTKRVHLKKLYELKKLSSTEREERRKIESKKVYSPELEATLKNSSWTTNLSAYKLLEDALVKQFSSPSTMRNFREGNSKSSFTYLLLDPRKTENLPCRADTMDSKDVWETFLSSIFYVGKGKKNRPYSHLYDAIAHYKQGNPPTTDQKIKSIIDIWENKLGVVVLHIFHNIIPVEAYTREAAMIEALRMENVANMKIGDFYGTASMWKRKEKCMLGTYLLYKAMNIFLQEGERQLSLSDIECG